MEIVKRGRVATRAAMAALVVFAMGCGEATGPEVDVSTSFVSAPMDVTLSYGQEAQLRGVLRLAFGELIQDSRCPINAMCVWAGNAEVEIGVAAGMGPTHAFRLNLNSDSGPQYVDWEGVRITLLEVSPLPVAGQDHKPEDYSIKLRVEAKE